MPTWLQITLAVITILGALCAVIAFIYRKSHIAQNIASRPYPCEWVRNLEEQVQRHDSRIDTLEKANVQIATKLDSTSADVKDIKSSVNKILLLLAEKGG